MMRGFISLLLGTFLVRGISFLATVVLTRVVGPSDFGTFALGLTVAQLFGVCANFGLDDLLVREISRAPGQAAHAPRHGTYPGASGRSVHYRGTGDQPRRG